MMPDHRLRVGIVSVGLLAMVASCAHPLRLEQAAPSGAAAPISQLWVSPDDLAARDLFSGPGGAALIPKATTYQFVKRDTTGASPGYDVRDAQGRLWSVKLGVEAQPEIAVSRLLWAIGFHQPAVYYVNEWRLIGRASGPQPAGRFRFEPEDVKVVDEWSWYENPFVNTQQFRGLIAANLLLNNWDFKTSNNKVYGSDKPERAVRHYVVRDLGASLGKTSQPALLRLPGFIRAMQGSKNDIEDFEAQGYVRIDESGNVDFDYKGNYGDLVKHVTAADVRWACQLFSRLSDRQITDAFRAARYEADITARYVKKIRAKIAEGLALAARSASASEAVQERSALLVAEGR